ncbi:hypothetical protein BaOVIS_013400 [Babesia ovis]|uniref:Uncharacterized protein n=1 Tax=Babesia ovis TaxID=5869 RepID=A0A9W5WUI1_BABOV|nr:hypothetical protein BaOVIS_013400 [Babesia ovis]
MCCLATVVSNILVSTEELGRFSKIVPFTVLTFRGFQCSFIPSGGGVLDRLRLRPVGGGGAFIFDGGGGGAFLVTADAPPGGGGGAFLLTVDVTPGAGGAFLVTGVLVPGDGLGAEGDFGGGDGCFVTGVVVPGGGDFGVVEGQGSPGCFGMVPSSVSNNL